MNFQASVCTCSPGVRVGITGSDASSQEWGLSLFLRWCWGCWFKNDALNSKALAPRAPASRSLSLVFLHFVLLLQAVNLVPLRSLGNIAPPPASVASTLWLLSDGHVRFHLHGSHSAHLGTDSLKPCHNNITQWNEGKMLKWEWNGWRSQGLGKRNRNSRRKERGKNENLVGGKHLNELQNFPVKSIF